VTTFIVPIKVYSGSNNKPAVCPFYPEPPVIAQEGCGILYGLWRQNCRVGPFRYSVGVKTWFGCHVDPSNNHKLVINYTSNFGEAWAPQDDTSFPTLTNEIDSFDAQLDAGANLICATQEKNTGRVAFHKFNTSTKVWSTLNKLIIATTNGSHIVSITQLSTGTLVLGYQKDKEGGTYERFAYVTSSDGGITWSAEINCGHWGITGTGFGGQTQNDILERFIPLDNGRMINTFAASPSASVNSGTERSLQNIQSDGTLTSIHIYKTGGVANVPWYMGDYTFATINGIRYVVVPIGNNDFQDVYLFIDDGSTDITASADAYALTNTDIPSGGNNGAMSTDQAGIRFVSNKFRLAYVTRSIGYGNPQLKYRRSSGGVVINAWTPDDLTLKGYQVGVQSAGTNQGFDAYAVGTDIYTATFYDGLPNSGIMFNLLKESSLPSSFTSVGPWIKSCTSKVGYAPSNDDSKTTFTQIILGAQTTLVGWYKLAATNALNNYNPIWGNDGSNEMYYGDGSASGKVAITMSGHGIIFRSVANIDHNWNLLAIVDNGASIKAYLNGVDMGNSIGGYVSLNGFPLSRTNQGQNGNNFKGSIDEALVFNRALSTTEIAALVTPTKGNIALAPWNTGLTLGFHFSEATGTSVADFSGNGHTGTMSHEEWGEGIVPET